MQMFRLHRRRQGDVTQERERGVALWRGRVQVSEDLGVTAGRATQNYFAMLGAMNHQGHANVNLKKLLVPSG